MAPTRSVRRSPRLNTPYQSNQVQPAAGPSNQATAQPAAGPGNQVTYTPQPAPGPSNQVTAQPAAGPSNQVASQPAAGPSNQATAQRTTGPNNQVSAQPAPGPGTEQNGSQSPEHVEPPKIYVAEMPAYLFELPDVEYGPWPDSDEDVDEMDMEEEEDYYEGLRHKHEFFEWLGGRDYREVMREERIEAWKELYCLY